MLEFKEFGRSAMKIHIKFWELRIFKLNQTDIMANVIDLVE